MPLVTSINGLSAIRARAILAGIAASAGLVLGLPDRALACSCMSAAPCQALWDSGDQAPMVFEATVASIEWRAVERVADDGFTLNLGTLVAQLKDVRTLLGEGATTITTPDNAAMCGYRFEVGRRYVIDAYRSPEGISTSLCSQTKRIEEAGALLSYIDSLSRPSRGATVTGTVRLSTIGPLLDPSDDGSGLADVRVTLDGAATRSTTTRADGSFAFDALPSGSYRLTVAPDADRALTAPQALEFRLPNAHACFDASVLMELDATIEGTVVDRAGQPVAGAWLALRRADGLDPQETDGYASARSDVLGSYQFSNVPPGRYVVGLNIDSGVRDDSRYLPAFVTSATGEPEIIDFPLGGHHRLLPVVAVPPATVTVTGRVVWPDGHPAAGMKVSARGYGEARHRTRSHVETTADADGRFSFVLADGQPYSLRAFTDPEKRTRNEDHLVSAEMDIVATSVNVTLLLRRRP